MLLNHFKSAWRNLWKRKEFSLLNLLGLAIGIAACLMILQYVRFENSYDKFLDDTDRFYRVNLGIEKPDGDQTEGTMFAANHPAVGPALKQDFPQIEAYTRLVDVALFAGNSVLSYKEPGGQVKTFYEEKIYIADSNFFSMFSYPIIMGDPETALKEPNTVVISENIAKKYFGNKDPMGKILEVNGDFPSKVTGVFKDLPENTHLKIDAIYSFAIFQGRMDNTWIWPEFYTYIKLIPGAKAQDLESQFEGFVTKYLGEVMKEFGIIEKMYLQPVVDIHLHSNLSNEAEENGNYRTISFLTLIAMLILFIAWMNYINLSTARSIERAAEVGIRKVVGAGKRHLITQFLIESAMMNLMAIFLGVILVQLFTPAFNQLAGREIISGIGSFALWQETEIWLALAAVFFGGTLLAGLYPAFVLSSFEPVKTLKGKIYRTGGKVNFRHVLVVLQFGVSLLLISGTLIVFNQLNFMRSQDMGFNMDQMLVVKSPSMTDSTYQDKARLLKEEILRDPSVTHFTPTSDIPGHTIQQVNSIKKEGQATEDASFVNYLWGDEDYFSTYGIELVAGRNFSEERDMDEDPMILTEKAVQLLGYSSPEEALDQMISYKFQQWEKARVIGVVKDINHRSLAFERAPFAFFDIRNGFTNYYCLKVNTAQLPTTISKIEEAYNRFFPGNPIEYFFLDDFFAKQYKADQRFGKVFGLFAFLAILVACLGLLGLASYIAARRTKEIGIRKVLGASTLQILMLLAKQFIILVLIAAVIAVPLAWWGGGEWLASYAYRSPISFWILALPVLVVALIAMATVVWQTLRTARTNPSDALRDE
ncbi:ABC transporter permease [bacterium]|nr:ABC transporter permease [bacterium]